MIGERFKDKDWRGRTIGTWTGWEEPKEAGMKEGLSVVACVWECGESELRLVDLCPGKASEGTPFIVMVGERWWSLCS